MTLYFITGNKNKFKELSYIIPDLKQLDIDLPEIQETDAKEVVKAKLLEAKKHVEGEFIVEDTSLYFDCLNGLPGPLIKWFLEKLGTDGLYNLTNKFNIFGAKAKTYIGYLNSLNEIHYFEGVIDGEIILPVGKKGFGWDCIFKPNGYNGSFAELPFEEKNTCSMRRIAANKLNDFINK